MLEQMALPGGGGAPGWYDCPEYYGYPTEVSPPDETSLELFRDPIVVMTCGWQPDETVGITLARPDGDSVSSTMQAEQMTQDYGVVREYSTTLDFPTGTYTITFVGESGMVSAQRQVIEPEGARLLFVPDSDMDLFDPWGPGQVWLYNFRPHERVRLFAYEDVTKDPESREAGLIAWQEYHTDTRGRIVVRVEPPAGLELVGYAAVGDVSGEAASYRYPYADDYPVFDGSVLDPAAKASAAATEPSSIPEKLEFIAHDKVICGGVSPMPGCVYIVEEWVSTQGTAAPGDPLKILVMDPRSGEAPDVAACSAAGVDRQAYGTSASPLRVRVRGEPCDLEPGYLFCVCDAEDFVRLEP
jgi:hypothetical protein